MTWCIVVCLQLWEMHLQYNDFYFSFSVFYLLRASCIISISFRFVWSIKFYLLFLRKSGIISKLPFLPPIYKAGKAGRFLSTGGKSDLGVSSFFFFFSFYKVLIFLNSSILRFSSSDYSVPLTSTTVNDFVIFSLTYGISTGFSNGFSIGG